ncbi:MAG TPA: DinB family protein [Chloroflexia bacterium]|nr:DinB family protein [Chloroflexia bacterium]
MEKALERVIEVVVPTLQQVNEADSGRRAGPGQWSKKEILGHLIDSALNNHQRFVRIQLANNQHFPNYHQEDWVSLQNYQAENWEQLVNLWQSVNLHLLHVIQQIPQEKLSYTAVVGDGQPLTLGFLLNDYLEHLKLHLADLLPGLNFQK